MSVFLDLFSFYNSQVGNWKTENKSKEISKYWLKVRQQSIMLKKKKKSKQHLHQETIVQKTYKNKKCFKCSLPVKDTKFASYHQREIMFSTLIWNTVHGLFRQEKSRVTTRQQNVMNIQLIFLLNCIILYLA